MVTLFRQSLVEVHTVIKYLHCVDETDLNRLLSLDWLASQEILNNYLAKHFQKHILLSKFHLAQRIGTEPASLPLLLEIVPFFQVIARSQNESPRTHTFISSKLKPSLGPSPLPGPPLRHSLLLAKETRFIIYSTAPLYIKVTFTFSYLSAGERDTMRNETVDTPVPFPWLGPMALARLLIFSGLYFCIPKLKRLERMNAKIPSTPNILHCMSTCSRELPLFFVMAMPS